ncbi:hypothetical protein, partial [Rhodococcus sp. (in: high G+C Gram-positive bacteria)]|uniref:hypothetical protein n=1 Tax=Rhodococcus sp. TaxID=1831 RepID=UPI0033147D71
MGIPYREKDVSVICLVLDSCAVTPRRGPTVPNGGDRSRGALSDRLTVAEELVICSIAWASS